MTKIEDFIDRHKTVSDEKTVLWCFIGNTTGYNVGYNLDWIFYESEREDGTIDLPNYNQIIMKQLAAFPIKKVYYKRFGKWYDFSKFPTNVSIREIEDKIIEYKDMPECIVDVEEIPAFEYIDENSNIYHINEQDGKPQNSIPLTELFNSDKCDISYDFVNIEEPANNNKPHLCYDLCITIIPKNGYTVDMNNLFICYNGFFSSYYRKSIEVDGEIQYTEPNRIYILKAKTYTPTKVIRDKITAEKQLRSPSDANIETVTLVENEPIDHERCYDIDLRIYSWENVSINDNQKVGSSEKIIYDEFDLGNDKRVVRHANYKYKLTFKNDIDEKKHILLRNGSIIPREEYHILNKRTIVLDFIDLEMMALQYELKSIYGYDYMHRMNRYINQFKYTLLNLEYVGQDNKEIAVYYDRNMIKNIPYPMHITFPTNINSDGILLMDGVVERYELKAKNIIAYPKLTTTPSTLGLVSGQSSAANAVDSSDISIMSIITV